MMFMKRNTYLPQSEWSKKGGTLSDKTARKEFKLTQDQIYTAVNSGKLHYSIGEIYGNPFFKFLRSEFEAYIKETCGEDYLSQCKLETELREVKRELRAIKKQVTALEQRKTELEGLLGK